MARGHIVTVAPQGRVSIPQGPQRELGIEPRDTLFVEREGQGAVLRYAKAENPFDDLASHAEQEYRAGRTGKLRDFAREHDTE